MAEESKKGILIVMSGVPGSGKSTRAKRMMQDDIKNGYEAVIYSADDIREELFGDASVQDDGYKVFKILEERVEAALKEGKRVYYDSTNRYSRGRKALVKKFKPFADKIICVRMNPPKEVAMDRNKSRSRVVPDDVMERYFDSISMPSKKEGFDMVYIVC